MDSKRAQTLDALENFIRSQKALLERTFTDIEKLKELRKDVENEPSLSPEQLSVKLGDPAFRLSEQHDTMRSLPTEIDWSLFKGADPTPFKTMAAKAREAYAARNVPPSTQLTAPSALRQFVAKQRRSVLDPVLSAFRLPDDLAALSSEDEEPDPEELRRAREREKIRELKKRRIEGDSGVSVFAGLGLRRPVAGVYIRRDQEDESAEVDISLGDEDPPLSAMGSEVSPMEVDTPATSVASSWLKEQPVQEMVKKRERRPSRKVQSATKAGPKAKTKAMTAQAQTRAEPEDHLGASTDGAANPPRDKHGNVMSETYKQAWSVSEQHLLERLLEEIPEGEKYRWSKISKAMNGRRTPRQVASRVQKYYEKLKRFGIEVGGKGGAVPG